MALFPPTGERAFCSRLKRRVPTHLNTPRHRRERYCPGVSPDVLPVLHAMPIASVFDYLDTRVNGPRTGTANLVINWRFTDAGESIASTLEHGALTSIPGKTAPNAMTTVTTTRPVFESVILRQRSLADAMEHR
jgi:alkyl sulfatase BDS1-like metallo-beta-lactamase superfamily hydrolase